MPVQAPQTSGCCRRHRFIDMISEQGLPEAVSEDLKACEMKFVVICFKNSYASCLDWRDIMPLQHLFGLV